MLNLPPIKERGGEKKRALTILPDNTMNNNSAYSSATQSPLLKSSSLSPQQMQTKRSHFANQPSNILAQTSIRSNSRHHTNMSVPDRPPQNTSNYNEVSQVNNTNKSQYYSMSQGQMQPQQAQQAYYNNSMSMQQQMGYGQPSMYQQMSTPLISVNYEYPQSYQQYYGNNGGGNNGASRLMQAPSFAKVANDEHDKKLLSLIERQTEVIGHLNSKIMQQENQKIQKDKRELRSRLKQLEMANAIKQRELEFRVQNTLLTNSPKLPPRRDPRDDDYEKKPNVKGSDRILSVLGKFVLATEFADPKKKQPRNRRGYGSFLQAAFQGLKTGSNENGLGLLPGTERIHYTENDQIYHGSKNKGHGEGPHSNGSNSDDDNS